MRYSEDLSDRNHGEICVHGDCPQSRSDQLGKFPYRDARAITKAPYESQGREIAIVCQCPDCEGVYWLHWGEKGAEEEKIRVLRKRLENVLDRLILCY